MTTEKNEIKFARDVVSLLRQRLGDLGELEIAAEVEVLHDISVLPDSTGTFSPTFHFLKQDIGVYTKAKTTDAFRRHFSRTRREYVAVPWTIIEVKYGSVGSEQLMVASSKAGRIKSIFPQCRYHFLARYGNKKLETLLRHSLHLNRVAVLERKQSVRTDYVEGDFGRALQADKTLAKRFDVFVEGIKYDLAEQRFFASEV